MELKDIVEIFGKENVKVLSDDPEIKQAIKESNARINKIMEDYSEESRSLNAQALSKASRAYLTQ